MTTILNIAGYKFVALAELAALKEEFLTQCNALNLKGTVLLSSEGININLAGLVADIFSFLEFLKNFSYFADFKCHETYSALRPFQRLKVKVKQEIITFRKTTVVPVVAQAPRVTPEILQQWLDEKRDITLIDTRNEYEITHGTFTGALNLHINHFCELPAKLTEVANTKPIVMFCTGGIRCEKAALYLLQQGFDSVFQLQGGILGYFAKVGSAHYQGNCFVFDERNVVKRPD